MKQRTTIQSSKCTPGHVNKVSKSNYSTLNLHHKAYSSKAHSCKNMQEQRNAPGDWMEGWLARGWAYGIRWGPWRVLKQCTLKTIEHSWNVLGKTQGDEKPCHVHGVEEQILVGTQACVLAARWLALAWLVWEEPVEGTTGGKPGSMQPLVISGKQDCGHRI